MSVHELQAPAFTEGRPVDRLLTILSRRCRHATAVVGRDARWWQQALAHHAGDIVTAPDAPQAAANGARFKMVIAADTAASSTADDVGRIAREAWPLVAPGGRLLVVATNGDALRPRTSTTMRELRRRLRPLAPPVFLGDQPFWWIVAELRKRRSNDRPPAARADRYDATITLCAGDVVELGCGSGDLAGLIHASGHRVLGVDMNAGKIAAARRNYPGVDFVQADITAFTAPDASFDTAVLAEVLEHVPAPVGDRMLDRAWRLIRPGGRLIVSVPHANLVPHRNHVREFTVGSLSRLLRRYGKPVFSADQPFKWMLAYVEKP